MKEYTLRNKATSPILTLSRDMLKLLLAARPESAQLTLAKCRQDYKQVTGKLFRLDHEQQLALLERAGADERGTWASQYSNLQHPYYHIISAFQDGFMNRTDSGDLCKDLALAEAFYALLDPHLPAPC